MSHLAIGKCDIAQPGQKPRVRIDRAKDGPKRGGEAKTGSEIFLGLLVG